MTDVQTAISQVDRAAAEKKVSATAVENIRIWLTDPRYAEYVPQVVEHISSGKWKQLDDVFWTIIPFGTGGRRGMMYPIGTNAIKRSHHRRECPRVGPITSKNMAGSRHQPARSPTTRVINRGISRSCVPK